MKKSILSILFIFSITFSNAQVWCPPGATWYYGFQSTDCDGYYKFTYIGDTTINSTLAKKIIQTYTGKCAWETNYQTGFVRMNLMYSDSDKVYFYKNGQFNILYDYSVQVGDTLNFLGPMQSHWGNCDSIGNYYVDSIGTTIINGENLRYYSIHTLNGSPFSWGCRIVEKIGPFYGNSFGGGNYFFPIKADMCGFILDESAEYAGFRCYSDDNFPVVSLTQNSCDYTLGVSELDFDNIQIFPNPAIDIVTFSFSDKWNSINLSVFDLRGKNIYFTSNISNENLTIDVSSFAKGMYFVSINSNGITLEVQKLVIE